MLNIRKLFFGKSTQNLPAHGAKSVLELLRQHRYKGINTSRTFSFERDIADWKRYIDNALSEPWYSRYDLYELYKRVVRDAHLRAQMRTRRAGTLSELYRIEKNSQDITASFKTKYFRLIIKKILDAAFFGLSAIELHPDEREGLRVVEFEPAHFSPERNLLLPLPEVSTQGIPLAPPLTDRLLIFQDDQENKLGLLADAAPYALYKSFSVTDWARHSERFGTPFTVLKTPTIDKTELAKYNEMLANFGNNGYAILDEADHLELLQPNSATKPFEIYSEMIKFCDEQISKIIVGQTATADTKAFVGSAEVQERILDWHVEEDMLRVQDAINNQVLPLLAKMKLAPENAVFKWAFFGQRNQVQAKPTETQNLHNPLGDFYQACGH